MRLAWRDYTGFVACSSRVSHARACSREAPHISGEGCSPPQKAGRCGWPNTLQCDSSSSWTHGIPAGFPCGMPGSGEVMEGEMQQAAQWGRQFIIQLSYQARVSIRTEQMWLIIYQEKSAQKSCVRYDPKILGQNCSYARY